MNPVLITCLTDGGTVITSTIRLSRELRTQYDQEQISKGKKAWSSPDILPWNAWLRRTWDLVHGTSAHADRVLNDSQLNLVWQDIIRRDVSQNHRDESPLWNIETTTRAAIRTLGLTRQWCMDTDGMTDSDHPDHVSFLRWLGEWRNRSGNRGWITEADLPERLMEGNLPEMSSLVFAGFDHLTTRQEQLIGHLISQEVQVEVMPPPQADFRNIPCRVYPTSQDQWYAAAEWARGILEKDSETRIAIVVTDLSACREELVPVLMETLAPGQVAFPGETRGLPFHVSLGDRLTDHPMGESLLNLLNIFSNSKLDLEQAEAFLLSPWSGGFREEMLIRSEAALVLRQKLPWKHTINDLHDHLTETGCSNLALRLSRALSLLDTARQKAPLSYWSELIANLATTLGWPREDQVLNSDEYQTHQAIREQIFLLGTLDSFSSESDFSWAVRLLAQLLGNRVFQPESHRTGLQVLDVQVAAGLEFDHLWFADLTEENWPPSISPDPFLPVPVQRAAKVPGSEPGLILHLTGISHGRIAASGRELIQSRPERDADTLLIPSPLIADCPEEPRAGNELPPLFDSLAQDLSLLKAVEEVCGPAHPGGKVSGGTGLIQRQSNCPRSAFLRDRLGARDHEFNRPGINPLHRGTLVHAVLRDLWDEIGDSRTLGSMSEEDLKMLIGDRIDDGLRNFRKLSSCGDRFFQVQRQWLQETLQEWFGIERLRDPAFKVIHLEKKQTLSLGGVELNFQIDRIDRFEDGTLGLIDYKTGMTKSPDNWFNPRPEEPQMPLYAISQDDPVGMVAFARVKRGECGFIGRRDGERFPRKPDEHSGFGRLQPSYVPQRKDEESERPQWHEYVSIWRENLEALVEEFLAGEATGAPRDHQKRELIVRMNQSQKGRTPDMQLKGICLHCPTPAFCRSANPIPEAIEGEFHD